MNSELADRLERTERIAIRAILIPDGADPIPLLAQHGMIGAVAIPCLPDDNTPHAAGAMSDGLQRGLQATLIMDQDGAGSIEGSEAGMAEMTASAVPDEAVSPTATAMLPSAYGMQPMAPTRRVSE